MLGAGAQSGSGYFRWLQPDELAALFEGYGEILRRSDAQGWRRAAPDRLHKRMREGVSANPDVAGQLAAFDFEFVGYRATAANHDKIGNELQILSEFSGKLGPAPRESRWASTCRVPTVT